MVLPAIMGMLAVPTVAIIITTVVAFLLITILGIFIPQIGGMFWGVVFVGGGIAIAILGMDKPVYSTGKWTITISLITLSIGLMFLAGLALEPMTGWKFVGGTITTNVGSLIGSTAGDVATDGGILNSISFQNIMLVISTTAGLVYLGNYVLVKRRK